MGGYKVKKNNWFSIAVILGTIFIIFIVFYYCYVEYCSIYSVMDGRAVPMAKQTKGEGALHLNDYNSYSVIENLIYMFISAILILIFIITLSVTIGKLYHGKKETKLKEVLLSSILNMVNDCFMIYEGMNGNVIYKSDKIESFIDLQQPLYNIKQLQLIFSEETYQKILSISPRQSFETSFFHCSFNREYYFQIKKYEVVVNKKSCKVIIFEDLTREKENERELQEALNSAKNASLSKSRFLSRMSHEIRTPMNGIIGMIEITKDKLENNPSINDATYCFDKIESSASYLLQIVNNILDFSKIESGKMTVVCEEFDLLKLVNDISNICYTYASKKKVEIVVRKHITNPIVFSDRVKLSQIFVNLISNAVKFSHENGQVIFDVNQEIRNGKSHVVFTIIDYGIGMAEGYENRIFNPYEQENDSINSKYGGTGLGLAITKNYVHMMNGELDINSKVNQGTTFTVAFDFEYTANHSIGIDYLANISYDFSQYNILLVEDNELNMLVAKSLLDKVKANTITAVNGYEAIKAIENSPLYYFDLILMDIKMPLMNGYETTEMIRALKRADAHDLKIIAMTADVFEEDIKKAMESSMSGHLSKPILPQKLYKTISDLRKKDFQNYNVLEKNIIKPLTDIN